MRDKLNNPVRRGLALVELMIVVTLLAILAAIVLPTFSNANDEATAAAVAAQYRTLADVVNRYHVETGQWPNDVNSGIQPPELDDYLASGVFKDSPLAGRWDYDNWIDNSFSTPSGDSIGIAITISGVDEDTSLQQAIDRILDDGDLSTGAMQFVDNVGKDRLMFILRSKD